jgi:dolichyl-phosphate-mannose-protein mannosyltransferase
MIVPLTSSAEIAFGSKVTLKNFGYGGGLLHSHVQTYPEGSNQQQVTCYHYKDENNNWIILPRWDEPAYSSSNPMRWLEHGDVIRLSHAPTTRNLHSHTVPSFVTKGHNEVSCYGNATIGDSHDYWVVEVVDDLKQGRRENVKRIHSLTTRLRFRHQILGCHLRAAAATLPQWGFKQTEVTCAPDADADDAHTFWNVESHWNERLAPGQARFYRSPFWHDFWHLNVAMMNSNNALVPDPDKEDVLASKPLDWPFLHLGLRMCGWSDAQTKFYLLGTPVIYFGGAISLLVALFALGVYLLRWQRKYQDMDREEWAHFLYVGKIAFLGWFFHYCELLSIVYLPRSHRRRSPVPDHGPCHLRTPLRTFHPSVKIFSSANRPQLPTLYFAVLMFAHVVDHFVLTSRILTARTKWITYGVLMFAIVANFWWFRGMALGIDGPIRDYWGVHWRKVSVRRLGCVERMLTARFRAGISMICNRGCVLYRLFSRCPLVSSARSIITGLFPLTRLVSV